MCDSVIQWLDSIAVAVLFVGVESPPLISKISKRMLKQKKTTPTKRTTQFNSDADNYTIMNMYLWNKPSLFENFGS